VAEVADLAADATVTILSLSANGDTLEQGSGFIVDSLGTVVTNAHVLRGASATIVVLRNTEEFDRVSVLDVDWKSDIAVLRITATQLSSLLLEDVQPVVGSQIVVVGSPLGLPTTVTEGIVSAYRVRDGRQLIQISAAINPGSSGGPVLNNQGRVVGVSVARISAAEGLGFSIPIRYVAALLRDPGKPLAIAQVFGPEAESASDLRESMPDELDNPDSAAGDWTTAPAIKAIRDIYRNIENEIASQDIREAEATTCDGVFVHAFRRSAGTVAKLSLFGPAEHVNGAAHYYYQDGRLRFSFRWFKADNGTHEETRAYFSEAGLLLHRDDRRLAGPGYQSGYDVGIHNPEEYLLMCKPER